MWDCSRLAKEWDAHHAQVLQTDHNESLAATIELSLSSPTFRNLGPKARDLIGVVAFFPQGIDENNLDWLFPTISNRKNIFDKFCVLSLAYRSNGFVTMLAPLRDYLCPEKPQSSPLLCATKDHYFTRLSIDLYPANPGYGEARWIISEDVNVEHLLYVFASIGIDRSGVWDACIHFMKHLYWHKPRQTVLRQKIESLSDDHRSKSDCLLELSWLFRSVGNPAEQKRLLSHAIKLGREREDDMRVAGTLCDLSGANGELGLYKEGLQQAKEALGIIERIGSPVAQAVCLIEVAGLLYSDNQLDAAEETVFRIINLTPTKGYELMVCRTHSLLGRIYRSKSQRGNALHHLEKAREIASLFDWYSELFSAHYFLAELSLDEHNFNDAQIHIEHAKSYTGEDAYFLGGATKMQAKIWFGQGRLEDARSEALCAVEIFEKIGAKGDEGGSRIILRSIEQAMRKRLASG